MKIDGIAFGLHDRCKAPRLPLPAYPPPPEHQRQTGAFASLGITQAMPRCPGISSAISDLMAS